MAMQVLLAQHEFVALDRAVLQETAQTHAARVLAEGAGTRLQEHLSVPIGLVLEPLEGLNLQFFFGSLQALSFSQPTTRCIHL